MADVNNTLKSHFFVCTNIRKDGRESCGQKGSENLRSALKELAKTELGKSIRINAAGCLGTCERGIVCVLYPQSQWFYDQTEGSEQSLLQQIKSHMKKEGSL